jgi:hypothetical protein
MFNRYAAYMIRCWRDDCALRRLEIVHIQSGERVVVESLSAALEWIDAHRPPDDLPVLPSRP